MESVFCQTNKDFEYIIIDGGSKDGSVEIIKYFTIIEPGIYTTLPQAQSIDHSAPYPIVYWISEPDTGIYQAMNKGILNARGEYCQFLNSGDWLATPDVIAMMLENLPDCSIFYGNVLKQMPDGKSYRDACCKGQVSMLTFYTGSLNHSPVFIKKKLFSKYGLYDENLKIVSDWKWYVLTIGLHNESIRYLDLDVVCFDMNGVSNTNQDLLMKERRQVLEELIPVNILADYDEFFKDIDSLKRINRNRFISRVFWFFERLLFKLGL
jgi:glycosyltransferase involved in cell wall biosynthesis